MVLIRNGDEQRAEYGKNRSSPPKSPLSDGHPKQRLPPTVEEGHADNSVAYKMTGLTDEMMHISPVRRADGAKKAHPKWIKPFARVVRRHRGRGLEHNHENAEGGRYPIQDWSQPGGFE